MAEVAGQEIVTKVRDILAPLGLESHPFKIGWYNDQLLDKAFALPHPYDTLGLVVISTPLMFDNGFKPFIRQSSYTEDALDQFMNHVFNIVKSEFAQHEVETIHDFEMLPSRRPKVLVQTAAHVAGGAYYYQRSSVSKGKDTWDEGTKIYGVSIHPKYGGWFAMRGVIIFKDVMTPMLPRKEPDDVVKGDEKKIELLEKFNFHWKDWSYRDVVPADLKYSEEQKKYFATSPANRKELLESYRQQEPGSSV